MGSALRWGLLWVSQRVAASLEVSATDLSPLWKVQKGPKTDRDGTGFEDGAGFQDMAREG